MRRLSPLLVLLLAACGAFAAWGWAAASSPATVAVDIRDIRGPLPLSSLPPFILSGGVLLLAVVLLLVRRRRFHRGLHEAAPVPPAVAPGPDAKALLARLAADYRQGACAGEQALMRLDRLLRSSLAASSGIHALQLTAAELLPRLEPLLDPGAQALLGDLLSLCDRVKFAGHRPAPEEVERALTAVASLLGTRLAGRVP